MLTKQIFEKAEQSKDISECYHHLVSRVITTDKPAFNTACTHAPLTRLGCTPLRSSKIFVWGVELERHIIMLS
jgi:hypothetical protein